MYFHVVSLTSIGSGSVYSTSYVCCVCETDTRLTSRVNLWCMNPNALNFQNSQILRKPRKGWNIWPRIWTSFNPIKIKCNSSKSVWKVGSNLSPARSYFNDRNRKHTVCILVGLPMADYLFVGYFNLFVEIFELNKYHSLLCFRANSRNLEINSFWLPWILTAFANFSVAPSSSLKIGLINLANLRIFFCKRIECAWINVIDIASCLEEMESLLP